MAKTKIGSKTKSSASTPRSSKKRAAAKPADADATEATIDRRRKSRRGEKPADAEPAPAEAMEGDAGQKLERRKKVNRRRQIDPTTCERDYSDQEVEFMNALDDYKRASGRMFPTCSEVLEVIRSLGYVKLSPAELAVRSESEAAAAEELAPSDEAAAHDDQDEPSDEVLEPAGA